MEAGDLTAFIKNLIVINVIGSKLSVNDSTMIIVAHHEVFMNGPEPPRVIVVVNQSSNVQ